MPPSSGAATGGSPPLVAPSYASVTQLLEGAPARGQWELRLGLGGNSITTGASTASTTQLYMGLDLSYNLGKGWSVGGGLYGAPDDGLVTYGLQFDVRYRFWDLIPLVKPTLFGGLGVFVAEPRTGKTRPTGLAGNFRLGAGLDFNVHPRILPGIALLLNVGPRFLPSLNAYTAIQTLFTLSFML